MKDFNADVLSCVEDLEYEVGLSGVPVYGRTKVIVEIIKGVVKIITEK